MFWLTHNSVWQASRVIELHLRKLEHHCYCLGCVSWISIVLLVLKAFAVLCVCTHCKVYWNNEGSTPSKTFLNGMIQCREQVRALFVINPDAPHRQERYVTIQKKRKKLSHLTASFHACPCASRMRKGYTAQTSYFDMQDVIRIDMLQEGLQMRWRSICAFSRARRSPHKHNKAPKAPTDRLVVEIPPGGKTFSLGGRRSIWVGFRCRGNKRDLSQILMTRYGSFHRLQVHWVCSRSACRTSAASVMAGTGSTSCTGPCPCCQMTGTGWTPPSYSSLVATRPCSSTCL